MCVKTRTNNLWMVLILHLIGGEGGASFLHQSQSEVQKKTNAALHQVRHPTEISLSRLLKVLVSTHLPVIAFGTISQ